MQITNQARNYALKHGVHVYGLRNDTMATISFYNIESDEKICSYKQAGDFYVKHVNHTLKPEVFDRLPMDIRTTQGIQMVIGVMFCGGEVRRLNDDEIAKARNHLILRATGVNIQ